MEDHTTSIRTMSRGEAGQVGQMVDTMSVVA